MPDSISKETFDHLVDLAALELDEQEAGYILRQLNHQLQAINELEAIPLDDLPVTPYGLTYSSQASQSPRADVWVAHPHPEEILAQAPQVEDGYIVVPEIPTTKLD
jgi:aspartyl-tRNA(Asn)/glutamyl-tRNA(Gln) amidotransferase subunit C